MNPYITAEQTREHYEKRGREAGEDREVVDCLSCGDFYDTTDGHRCRTRRIMPLGVGFGLGAS